MDDALQTLIDRQAITDQIYRYCRAMDRIDAELGYAVWHDDGEADYGAIFRGSGRGFVDFALQTHRRALAHTHQVTNILLELAGDRAASEACFVSALQFQGEETVKQVTTWGRYLDQWSRRAGRWAIDKRLAILDVAENRDVTIFQSSEAGRRDRSDPSYGVFESLA